MATAKAEHILAWHFAPKGPDDRPMLGNNDGRIIEIGETLSVKGKIEICRSGLHASRRIIDALSYSTGPIICRVELWGDVTEQSDKLVARNRKCLWYIPDSEGLLHYFARLCAMSVLDKWDAPDVVLDYLATGDERLRSAADSAADSAARLAFNDLLLDLAEGSLIKGGA